MSRAPVLSRVRRGLSALVARLAGVSPAVPAGMGAFLAGVLLLAVPIIAMVASATAPTERGHWVVLAFGLALIVHGAARGIDDVS